MTNDTNDLMAQIHRVVEMFIKRYYAEEERFLPAVWEAFDEWAGRLKEPLEKIDIAEVLLDTQTGLGFAGQGQIDLVPPIVLSTVAETLQKSQSEKLSTSKLERIVGKAAIRAGAAGELLACLIGHLPALVIAVRNSDPDVSEAYISVAKKLQYKILTGGENHKIVDSIDKFRGKQDTYLFWIDITNKEYLSLGIEPEQKIGPTAIKILVYLVKNIGVSIPRRKIFEDVFEETTEENIGWVNRLQQFVTQLHNFTGKTFREKYLLLDRISDCLSLKNSFKNKYFIFETLRALDE